MRAIFVAGLSVLALACAGESPEPLPQANGEENVFRFSDRADQPQFEQLQADLAQRPDDPAAHRRLAMALREERLHQEALPHFMKAAELSAGDTRYQLDLAAAFTSVARFTEAERVYRPLLEVSELRPTVLHNLGNLALRRDDLASAIEHYEQALAQRADYLLARYHLAIALQQSGRLDEAYAAFRAVLELPNPEGLTLRSVYYDAVYRVAMLELEQGHTLRAGEILQQLLKNHPEHPNAWYGYARVLMLLGKEQEAKHAFERQMRVPERTSGRLGYVGSPWLAESVAATGNEPLWFVDATREAGIEYTNVCGSAERKRWITETLGSGAAWLDFDGDGVLDLYLVNGSDHERPAGQGEPNRLYRGDGRGRFSDVTSIAGVGHRGWGQGVAVGDVDSDGDPDLYVTNYGPNVLYLNEGDGTFTDVTDVAGVGHDDWGTSAAFFDMEGDGDLDLYVANYLACDPQTVPQPGESTLCGFKGIPTLCGPRPLPPQQDVLYRNEGDGTFTDVTLESGVGLDEPLYALGVVTGDYDNDGDQDVYVANDSVRNLLWRNRGDGTFEDVAVTTMSAVGAEGRAQSGMGVDLGDYDGDGWLDIAVTNFSDDLNTIYRNVDGRYFLDDSSALGLSVTYPALSWGVGFQDLDSDADLDLFIANGHIYPEMDDYDLGTTYRQANHLFVNREGTRLIEISSRAGPGLEVARSFRGAAFGDYDGDGDVDVILTAIDDAALLLRNDSADAGHWLQVSLIGTRSNKDAVGARVTLTAAGKSQIRERIGGGSYLSANSPHLHFGLGAADVAERIEVRWPSGAVDVLEDVPADRRITIVERRQSDGTGSSADGASAGSS